MIIADGTVSAVDEEREVSEDAIDVTIALLEY
jgi:hypothetical protein